MNRVAVWVAQTAVGATVPMALAQATATPLPEIEAGARLDPDIAAQPLVALNVILGREGMARGASIQRAKIQRADALTVHPVTAANDSRIVTKTVLFRCRRARGIARSSWAQAAGPSRAAEGGSRECV
jgi:hypothetical protein